MKLLATLLVAALAALGAQRFGSARAARSPGAATDTMDLDQVVARAQELRRENERLAREIERRTSLLATSPAPADEVGEVEIAAALERWRAAHPEEVQAAAARKIERTTRTAPGEVDLASIPMLELVQTLSRSSLTNFERQELFQKLREAGRIDEYVAAIEKLAAEDPENADLQVALGNAYLQKLFAVGNTPEAGKWAPLSDSAFDRALELDEENWGARFSKAVSLSNWPAFLGRGPEAIEHFEILLEQQATQPKQEQFALTYLFLGNMQQAGGERDKAIATWRAGLELFPDMDGLRQALAGAEASGTTERPADR